MISKQVFLISIVFIFVIFGISYSYGATCFPDYSIYRLYGEQEVYMEFEGVAESLLFGPIFKIEPVELELVKKIFLK